ncbi:hypothetical protein [Thermocrinis minervae]|uniref:Uncharacterized protein n=1 Tax=Thermocrinis minervae TaxID=381751 RepID=A0A1M6T085_9AQUI|nr:hypothetical protein [Thermocrinis minervae]SHK50218.1 hypothetical protein SAMN05444391_1237 [Thermocrinis minervae]
MKAFLQIALLFAMLTVVGWLIYLNQGSVSLVLTPPVGGVYYVTNPLPLGLFLVIAFLIGLLLGYLIRLLQDIFK